MEIVYEREQRRDLQKEVAAQALAYFSLLKILEKMEEKITNIENKLRLLEPTNRGI